MARKKVVCCRCEKSLTVKNYNKDARNKGNNGLRYDCKLCQYKTHLKGLTKKVAEMEELWKKK